MLCEILSNELMVDSVIYDYIYHNQWIKVKSRMLPRRSGFAIGHIMFLSNGGDK